MNKNISNRTLDMCHLELFYIKVKYHNQEYNSMSFSLELKYIISKINISIDLSD